jgi:hypothetical protein
MESGTRSESTPVEVSPLLVRRSRYAVSPYLGCAVFLQRTAAGNCLSDQPRPLVELHVPLECYPATPTRMPQHSGPLMGFGSLQHIKESRSTDHGHARPLRSAFRVWLPS